MNDLRGGAMFDGAVLEAAKRSSGPLVRRISVLRVRRFACAVGASTLAMLSAAPVAMAGGNHGGGSGGSANVLLTDLSSPKGLAVAQNRNLIIAQGAFGAPGPVLEYDLRGRDRGTVTPLTDAFGLIDVAISPRDGTGWALGPSDTGDGSVHLFHQLSDGTIVDVKNITAYQMDDPDPVDHDDPPNPTESNPYGLTVMRNGDALVADAAGNDIIRVSPDGSALTVARFDLQAVATDLVPPGILPDPAPPTLDAEAVPTTVAIGPDGAIYVGELKGFPFRPGSSNIWRIRPDADGAWCSVNTPDPTDGCSLYSSGYTAIQDITFDKYSGRLYVLELAAEGVFAFEAGFDEATGAPVGPFPPAVLLEVQRRRHGDKRTELASGQLSEPGGIVTTNGRIYVTDGIFLGGRLVEIKRGH